MRVIDWGLWVRVWHLHVLMTFHDSASCSTRTMRLRTLGPSAWSACFNDLPTFVFLQYQDDEIEDSGSECVICMSDIRDTLILPCRHLCLCNGCADSLRFQSNNCPICRAPFRALLQIRAMRKKLHIAQTGAQMVSEELQSITGLWNLDMLITECYWGGYFLSKVQMSGFYLCSSYKYLHLTSYTVDRLWIQPYFNINKHPGIMHWRVLEFDMLKRVWTLV